MRPNRILHAVSLSTLLLVIFCKMHILTAQENGESELEEGLIVKESHEDKPREVQDEEPSRPKQSRELFNLLGQHARRAPELKQVRQDIYNFYNIGPSRAQPSRSRPWLPRPNYAVEYDDDYYQSRPYPNHYPNPYQQGPAYPFMPVPFGLPLPPSITSTTTTTPAPLSDPTKPIGYMLIDTYHTPSGSYSKPIAFFGT